MGGCQSECSKCIDEVGDYTGRKPSFIAMDPQNTCCSICLEGVQQEVDVNVDRDEIISSDAETTPPDRDRGPGVSAAGPFPIAGEKEPETAVPETALFIATQKRDGSDYWLRLDCGHVLHADCIQNRFRACVRKDHEKYNFAHTTCPECRSTLSITDTNQPVARRMLRDLLQPTLALREKVEAAMWTHAREDPIDQIEGIENMEKSQAEGIISRKIGAFQCSRCKDIFCQGIACGDVEEEEAERRKLLCPDCVLRSTAGYEIDYSKCPEPLYKCDLCCSVAKYRCPDYYQCEKHHSQGRKTLEMCPGGKKCPLGIKHPQNAHVRAGFIIGCGCGKCR